MYNSIEKENKLGSNETIKAPSIAAIQEKINKAKKDGIHIGDISDTYHTFDELYHHRAILFLSLCLTEFHKYAWKSLLHELPEDKMYPGMFVVGITTPEGEATYHYNIDPYWSMFDVKELPRAPKYDGHTPEEAINRIYNFAKKINEDRKKNEVTLTSKNPIVNPPINGYGYAEVPCGSGKSIKSYDITVGDALDSGVIDTFGNPSTVQLNKDQSNSTQAFINYHNEITDDEINKKLIRNMTFSLNGICYSYKENGLFYKEDPIFTDKDILYYIDDTGTICYLESNVASLNNIPKLKRNLYNKIISEQAIVAI